MVRVPTWRVPGVGVPLSPRLPGRFRETIRSLEPDVVHVHASIWSAGALAGGWAAHREGVPIVMTLHSLLGGQAWVHRLSDGLVGWGRWPQVVAGVSPPVADQLTRVLGRSVTVLGNGVDTAWWREGRGDGTPAADGTLRLIAVQRLHRRKRGLTLVEAVARAQSSLPPGTRLSLRVVGDGPQRDRMKARAESLGVDISFSGALSAEGVRAEMSGADLFVSACDVESFGLAAAEARAFGLPVIAWRVGALPDFVRDGEDGYLVDSEVELSAAIQRVAGSGELLRHLSEGSRERPPACDWKRVVEEHTAAYEDAARHA